MPFKRQAETYTKQQEEYLARLQSQRERLLEEINNILLKEPLSLDPFPEAISKLNELEREAPLLLKNTEELKEERLKKISEQHNSLYFKYAKHGKELVLQEEITRLKKFVILETQKQIESIKAAINHIEEQKNSLPEKALELKNEIIQILTKNLQNIEEDCSKIQNKLKEVKNL